VSFLRAPRLRRPGGWAGTTEGIAKARAGYLDAFQAFTPPSRIRAFS
jgi:hypothetical protein